MNDEEYEAQKARVDKLAETWIKSIGLGWWRIEIVHVRDSGNYSPDGEPSPDGVACCKADWRYGHATVTFNLPRVAEKDDASLEWIFVHELMHIFLNELRAYVGDSNKLVADRDDWLAHEERAASTLASGFIWLRDSMREVVH